MSHIDKKMKRARQELSVSSYIPFTHMNSPTIVESKNGSMVSVIKLSGTPFSTEKTDVINVRNALLHRAITMLGDNFTVIGNIHRRKVTCDLEGNFTNPLSKEFDADYQQQFKSKSLYVNDLYLTICYKGLDIANIGIINRTINVIKKSLGNYIKEARVQRRERDIKTTEENVYQLMMSLGDYNPVLLGSRDDDIGYSELLSFLSMIPNGGDALKLKRIDNPASADRSIDKIMKKSAHYPMGNLAQYIPAKQILFGDYIQFQGATDDDVCFGAIVTIKKYSDMTCSIMLDPLLHLDSEFISTQSFMFENKHAAASLVETQQKRLSNSEDKAEGQISDIDIAQDDLASDRISMGLHHNTVMLLSDNMDDLDEKVAQTIKCYLDVGITAVKEKLGQEPAFWSQIPTNSKYITRASIITSRNFTDFFPLHNYRTGYFNHSYLGSAMMLAETPSRTPLYLNLHAEGDQKEPSNGHTTIIGGNNSGKTVMMCAFDSELNRYGGKSFFFDRDRGTEVYVRASGGHYATLSPNHHKDIHFNPFQLDDTPDNRKFCRALLKQMVKKEDEVDVDDDVSAALSDCVDYAFEKLSKSHRTLTNATKLLPVKFARWSRLRKWLRSDGTKPDGEYAYLFDNDVDKLSLHDKMGFDMSHFIDNEPESVLSAVTMYLLRRIELSLSKEGTLVSIFLDEAWQYLDNAYWKGRLKKWLPTLRKYNCHIVFATQSPKTVANSPISHVILDNCATNIYFSNPQAKTENYIDGFNLTPEEYTCIKENQTQSRIFLYKQANESTLGRLNLGHLPKWLTIMSGTPKKAEYLDYLREKLGDDPKNWLPTFLSHYGVAGENHYE